MCVCVEERGCFYIVQMAASAGGRQDGFCCFLHPQVCVFSLQLCYKSLVLSFRGDVGSEKSFRMCAR